MQPKLGVSIINYRTGPLTIGCARSVLDAGEGLPVDVVLVDNASGDGSAEEIAAWLDTLPETAPVRLIRSDRNTGFSGGHNLGMAALPDADWVLLLNSDATLRPGFFTALTERIADAPPRTGFIAPQIETMDGTVQVSCFRFHSPVSELIRGAGSGPVTRLLQRWDVPLHPPVPPETVEWVSFAGVLINVAMIGEIGPMDEGYFLYFEDAEYSLRGHRAGWGLLQAPHARMVHFRGGSGPVKSLEQARRRLPRYFYASRTRFFRQAYGRLGPLLANTMYSSGRAVAQLRRMTGRPVPRSNAREIQDIWTNFFDPLGSEKTNNNNK